MSETALEGILALFGAGFSVAMFVASVIPMLISIASVIIWIVALVDIVQRDASEFPNALRGQPGSDEKLLWLLIVLLTSAVGSIVYYFMVMKPYPRGRGGA